MKPSPHPISPRLVLLGLLPLLACLGLAGMLWGGSTLPETSRQLFGTRLAGDILRPTIYGLALLIPGSLAVLRLRSLQMQLWRGVALACALAGGYALLAGGVLALNRALPWPGIPDALPPLVSLAFAGLILWAGRGWFSSPPPLAQVLCGTGLGLLVSSSWVVLGSLGTLSELGVALLEALAISLLSTLFISAVFYFEPETLASHPRGSGLLAAAVLAALLPGLLAVRGWAAQSFILALVFIPSSLVAGALLVLDQPPQPRRAVWMVLAFFIMAWLLPLAFTDGPDGDWIPGGIPQAAYLADLISLLTTLGLGVLLLAGRTFMARLASRLRLSAAFCILILLCSAGLYAAYGGVGLQPQTFFVVMSEQADTRFAQGIANRQERTAAVYHALTAHALNTQAALRADLDAQGVVYHPYYLINGLEVQGGYFLRRALAHRPDVARILDTPRPRPTPPRAAPSAPLRLAEERLKPAGVSWGVASIKADQVWQKWGITGQGITIGAIGSGVDWIHPDLQAAYLGAPGSHDFTWYDPWEGTPAPVDTSGIGTHTLATALGAHGVGVAPGARWIACRSLARDLGNIALYLDCMQFLLAPFPQRGNAFTQGNPARAAQIVSAAWNCPPLEGCDATTLSTAVTHLRDAGQMFVTGAGNDGPACSTIGPPGLAEAALTVGAVDKQGSLANFSSRGPITLDGSTRLKPEVVAPGVGIFSSLPDGRYAEFNGTSMASSHVAGLVALLWSANPALVGDIERTRHILTRTARPIPTPAVCGGSADGQSNASGYGLVDALEAVHMALAVP